MKTTRLLFSPFPLFLLLGAAGIAGCAAPDVATPPGLHVDSETMGHVIVVDDQQRAIALAQKEGKLLLYNFTGFNCATCRAVESAVLVDPAVAALTGADFIESRQHTDTQNTLTAAQFADNKRAQARLASTVATPYFVVVDPNTGSKVAEHALSGGPSAWAPGLVEFLEQAVAQAGR